MHYRVQLWMSMQNNEVYFLTKDLHEQITNLIAQFVAAPSNADPSHLIENLKNLLPIEKMNRQTILKRVEGFSIVADLLWEKVVQIGSLDRQQIVARAKLKPMSYYHYLTGSREVADYAISRDDLMNDPTTAMVKLNDDIIALARLIIELK
jgi:hypothetical protein